MDPVRLSDMAADLHALVDSLCSAPAAERATALRKLTRHARLYLQVKTYQEARVPIPQAEAEPPAPEPVQGPFVRLRHGGKVLHASGEHFVPEEAVTEARLQHGDVVLALPAGAAGYVYSIARPGPLTDPQATTVPGYLVPLDDDLALLRTTQGSAEVIISMRDLQRRGATLDDALSVAYHADVQHDGRYLGRVLTVYATPESAPASPVRTERGRRRRLAPPPVAERKEPLPQFQPVENRRPKVVVVGGHPPNRAKFEQILADYGAELYPIPYSPKVRQVRRAVEASNIVIGMAHCCRTGHWDSAKETARSCNLLLFCGESECESGLRYQLENEIIPRWNRRVAGEDA